MKSCNIDISQGGQITMRSFGPVEAQDTVRDNLGIKKKE